MMNRTIDLITKLRDAREQHIEAKQVLTTHTHEYEEAKATAYLACGESHYVALAKVAKNKSVVAARQKMDEADVVCSRAWVQCQYLNNLVSAELKHGGDMATDEAGPRSVAIPMVP